MQNARTKANELHSAFLFDIYNVSLIVKFQKQGRFQKSHPILSNMHLPQHVNMYP